MSIYLNVVHHLDAIAFINIELHRKRGSAKESSSSSSPSKTEKTSEAFEPECDLSIAHLNSIVSLLSSTTGKEAVVSVLGLPGLAEILFPYMMFPAHLLEDKEGATKELTCFGYAVDIFLQVVKFQDDVRYLEFYSDVLSKLIISWENIIPSLGDDSAKLSEIVVWLSLIKNPDIFNYDNFTTLSNVVQESMERLEKFPGELITSLRILRHLSIPYWSYASLRLNCEDEPALKNDFVDELKYRYSVTQLFSSGVYTHLINILSKLYGFYQQPFVHSSDFVSSDGSLVIALIKPTVTLLDAILNSVIQARNAEFKDLSTVVPLIQIYALLEAFPSSSSAPPPYYYNDAGLLKQTVVKSLLRFVQVVYTHEGEDVLLSKSLWTQMMTEVNKISLTFIAAHWF